MTSGVNLCTCVLWTARKNYTFVFTGLWIGEHGITNLKKTWNRAKIFFPFSIKIRYDPSFWSSWTLLIFHIKVLYTMILRQGFRQTDLRIFGCNSLLPALILFISVFDFTRNPTLNVRDGDSNIVGWGISLWLGKE